MLPIVRELAAVHASGDCGQAIGRIPLSGDPGVTATYSYPLAGGDYPHELGRFRRAKYAVPPKRTSVPEPQTLTIGPAIMPCRDLER